MGMGRRGGLRKGLVVLVTGAALLALPGRAGATAGGGPAWPALEQDALQAAQAAHQAGTVQLVDSATAASSESFTTTGGTALSVSQETVVAEDSTGQFVMAMSLLGGKQLVVGLTDYNTRTVQTLVLAPSSAAIVDSHSGSETAVAVGNSVRTAGHRQAHTSGCTAAAQPPTVIWSIFGLLIQGVTQVVCIGSHSFGILSSLYESVGGTSTQIGNTGSATGSGLGLSATAFAPCTLDPNWNPFQTAGLVWIDGVLQAGLASAWTWLGCQ